MQAAVTRPASPYERLVDRYVDVMSWPTARKTAALMAVAVPFHVTLWAFSHLALRSSGDLVRIDQLDALHGAWLAAIVAVLALCVFVGREKREARWTVHLMVLVYGAFIAAMVHFQGTWSTPYLVFYPQALLLVTLFYGASAGSFAFLCGTALILGLAGFELAGVLPYAPLFVERRLDAQLTLPWVATQIAFLLLIFLYYSSVLRFSESARDRQRQRLEAALRELAEARSRLERGNVLIRRYVPSQLADHLLSDDYADRDRPERRKVTVLFSDVEGFTEVADRLEPEDLAALLNEYLGEMARVAEAHGGTVEHFVGDGITILFGAPRATSDRDQALRAVRTALAMQRRMKELQHRWFESGIEAPFRVRIGINTGVASVGSFGSAGRMTYSAIGTQTNLAARIQSHCPPGSVLVSHATWALVKDESPCVDRGELQVKGIHFPVRVYEVLDGGTSRAAG